MMTLIIRVVLPVLVAGVVLIIAWRPWQRSSKTATGQWATGLALGVGFCLSLSAQENWTPWAGWARWHAALPLALGATALGLFSPLLSRWRWGTIAAGVTTGTLGSLVVDLPGVEGMTARGGLGLVILLLTVGSAPLAKIRPAASMSLSYSIVLATLSALLWTSHFAKLGMIAGSLSVICLLITVTGFLCQRPTSDLGGCVVCSALIPTTALIGYAYDYGTVWPPCWALVSGAILCHWAGELPRIKRLPTWAVGWLRVTAVASCCAVALALSFSIGKAHEAEDPYLDYAMSEHLELGPSASDGPEG